MQALRNNVIKILPSRIPPRQISNLKVTPVAGGNYIQFSKSDGDNYAVYVNTTANFDTAAARDVGQSPTYVDNVGDGGKTRYYWVVAKKSGQPDSQPFGPVSGTTLALGTSATVPTPPPASDSPSSSIDGNIRYGTVRGESYNVY